MPNITADSYRAFFSELEKIAVLTTNLLPSVQKAENVHIGPHVPGTAPLGGAMTYPTARQTNNAIQGQPVLQRLRQWQGQVHNLPTPLQGPANETLSHTINDLTSQAKLHSIMSPKGHIGVNPNVTSAIIPVLANAAGPSSAAERDALTGVLGAHELHERRVAPRNIARLHSHLAPEVLLKEHNLLSRIEGPGADYARNTMRALRTDSGEAAHMRNLLTSTYGDRAGQFLEEGQRVPKAMLRDLRRKIQVTPGMVAAAHPENSMSFFEKARKAVSGAQKQYRMAQVLKAL